MILHLIGCGCSTPAPRQFGSAFALELDDTLLLVDCGPATTYKMVRMGVDPLRIDHVFLTHHHFDHTADMACFALTRWNQCIGAEAPLSIYGPRPTRRFIDMLLRRGGAYSPDWQARLEHPASLLRYEERGGRSPRSGPRIEATDLTHADEVTGPAWRVLCARVAHVEPGLMSLAFRFEAHGRSIVFAGDCTDCEELRDLAAGADTLVVACAHPEVMDTGDRVARAVMGVAEVAAVAAATAVGRVVLTHVSPVFDGPGTREQAIARISASYEGEILFPDELQSVELTDRT